MDFKELIKRHTIDQNKKLTGRYGELDKLIEELSKREIPLEIVEKINKEIEILNSFSGSDKALVRHLRRVLTKMTQLLEKELKLVTINYYRNMWLALGLAVFGIPMGVVMSSALGNFAFIGAGICMGMVIGMGFGAQMDKKAAEKGKQLNVEIKN